MVGVQFIVGEETPVQVTIEPAQNTELTQHEPVQMSLISAVILVAAVIIIYQAIK
jgi:hypothetical protein